VTSFSQAYHFLLHGNQDGLEVSPPSGEHFWKYVDEAAPDTNTFTYSDQTLQQQCYLRHNCHSLKERNSSRKPSSYDIPLLTRYLVPDLSEFVQLPTLTTVFFNSN